LTLIVGIAAVSVFAQKVGDAVQPKKANVGIYANQIREAYEQPVATIGTGDILQVLDAKGSSFKVRTSSGTEGWVQKSDVNKAQQRKDRSFAFEAAEVIGYLDNPTPVYIIDMDDPNADPITLDRSFKDALKENVDKETMERLAR
jgi:hypothetical protein